MRFKTVKRIVSVFTGLLLLNGLVWVITGSVILNQNIDIDEHKQTSEYPIIQMTLYAVIYFGGFLIFWSFVGIFAIARRHNCLLGTFNVGILLILTFSNFLLVMSIYLKIVLPEFINDTHCKQNDLLIKLRRVNQQGVSLLCKKDCMCKYTGSSADAAALGITYYDYNYGELKAETCPTFKTDLINLEDGDNHIDYFENYASVLNEAEILFKCSGVCSVNSFYTFNNINYAPPNRDCKLIVLEYINSHVADFVKAASALYFILFFNLIFSCCLCVKKRSTTAYFEKDGIGFFTKD